MSSNLVKQMYAVLPQEEKRVIDSNARVKKRLEEYESRRRLSGEEGFVSGLMADSVEMPEDAEVKIIKAREDAGVLIEVAQREAQDVLESARAEAAKIIALAVAEAESEKARVLEQAKIQGYNEGRDEALAQVDEIEREYHAKANQLEQAYQQQVSVLEPQFVDVITDIYEHIFHVELGSYRDILTHLIAATLHKLEGGHEFMIHVSKEDYPYVSMQKKQIVSSVAANCSVDIVEDVTLGKNECMIETESGIYDCGLGTQMEELKRKLMLLAWSKED